MKILSGFLLFLMVLPVFAAKTEEQCAYSKPGAHNMEDYSRLLARLADTGQEKQKRKKQQQGSGQGKR